MITRVEGGQTYTQVFNAENRLISVTVNSQTTEFIYDGDGNMVKKINPDGSKTIYVSGLYEVDKSSGGSVTRTVTYYPAAGATLAPHCVCCSAGVRIDSTLYYALKDHLGSASVVTHGTNGSIVGEQRYNPYGETRLTTGSMFTDKLFTGQREIAGLGIYHYGARFYSPKLARFISADTIVPGAGNPQAYNRYSYVFNNPLRYTDPTGHEPGACQDSALVNGSWVCNPTFLETYGVSSEGLNDEQEQNALNAATNFGQYFYQTYGTQYGFSSPQDAFKKVTGGNITIMFDPSRVDCITNISTITCGSDAMTMKTFVHEFFHVMDNNYQGKTDQMCGSDPCWASSNLPYEYYTDETYTRDAYCSQCVSHPYNLVGYDFLEAFANAGENLVLGALNIDPANNGFKDNDSGREVMSWMNNYMPGFLDEILGVQ